MSDSSSRLFGVILILVAVWIGTYWLWEPRSARSETSDALARLTPESPLPASSENRAAVEPPRTDLAPLPISTPAPASEAVRNPPAASEPPPTAAGEVVTRKVQKRVEPRFREYVVQKGDVSWQSIAARKEVYGDARMWQAVSRANPLVTSDRLKPGVTRLKIAVDPTNIQGKLVWVDEPVPDAGVAPSASVPAPAPSAEPPAREKQVTRYTIKADDTLWSIARRFYGKGNQWRRIYEANKDVIPNPDRPSQGVTITIPDASDGRDASND